MRRVWAKALTLTLILNLSLFFPTEVRAARYIDMPGNWAEKYVNQLSDEGVIPAEKDGKFRPNDPVTRAVLSFWLVNTLGIKDQAVRQTVSFNDVKPDDWYYKSVELVKQNNYIAGYPDGFRPSQFIQRGEVITIMSRTLTSPDPDESAISQELAKYKDGSKVPSWARMGVAKASLAGLTISYLGAKEADKKELRASTLASRADTAALLFSLDDYKTQKSIADATNRAESGLPPLASSQPAGSQQPLQAQQPQFGQQPQYAQQPQFNQQPRFNQQPQLAQQPQMVAQPPVGAPVNPPFMPYNSGPPFGQPAMAQGYGGQYQTPGGYPPQGQYQGQVQQPYGQQGGYGGQQYGGGYAPPQQGGYPPQGQYGGGYPPANGYLQGRVAVVAAGTEFHASVINTLDSGSSQPGEQVTATLSEPLYANGQEVIPAGSRIIGAVTNVVSARHFKFGANGRIDVRFTSIETPDGRRFPLSASIDANQMHLTGGTTGGRVGKGLLTTGVGAAGGAALGTGLGAITGGLSHSRSIGMSTGMGAAFGSAMGGVVGLGAAAYRKGGEVKITAGTALPIRLDESLQVAGGPPPVQQPYGGGYGGGYPPPVQQPAGGYYPQPQ